jgi:hypothetical protein
MTPVKGDTISNPGIGPELVVSSTDDPTCFPDVGANTMKNVYFCPSNNEKLDNARPTLIISPRACISSSEMTNLVGVRALLSRSMLESSICQDITPPNLDFMTAVNWILLSIFT